MCLAVHAKVTGEEQIINGSEFESIEQLSPRGICNPGELPSAEILRKQMKTFADELILTPVSTVFQTVKWLIASFALA